MLTLAISSRQPPPVQDPYRHLPFSNDQGNAKSVEAVAKQLCGIKGQAVRTRLRQQRLDD